MSSKFGLDTLYTNNKEQLIPNLAKHLTNLGFSDFSPEGISSFLTFRYPIGDLTMFKDVKRIPFGYNHKLERRWYPRFPELKIDFDSAVETIKCLLKREIYLLGQDEKIAIPLSGGVDSSIIVALTREVFPTKIIKTYTATFKGASESKFANQVAREYLTEHFEYEVSMDQVLSSGLLENLIAFKGEPLHPNELALAIMEQWAKKDGCTIALCGEGGDDIFGGYSHNLRMHFNHELFDFWEFFLNQYRYFSIADRIKIVNEKYLVNDLDLLTKLLISKEIPKNKDNRMLYFLQKIHTPGLITRGANAMRFAGLKTGFPYINSELVNFVNALPFDYKVAWKHGNEPENANMIHYKELADKHSISKFILKKLGEQYFDKEFIHRSKIGFPVPFVNWFKNINDWWLDEEIFKTTNISSFSAWHKFMLINLNQFIKYFRKYQK